MQTTLLKMPNFALNMSFFCGSLSNCSKDTSEFKKSIFYKSNQSYNCVKVTFLPAFCCWAFCWLTGQECIVLDWLIFPHWPPSCASDFQCCWVIFHRSDRAEHLFLYYFFFICFVFLKNNGTTEKKKCWKCAKHICL